MFQESAEYTVIERNGKAAACTLPYLASRGGNYSQEQE